MTLFEQIFNDAVEALRVSYKKMNPFCVPFATTNVGSAILAMDLVSSKSYITNFLVQQIAIYRLPNCRDGWALTTQSLLLVQLATFAYLIQQTTSSEGKK